MAVFIERSSSRAIGRTKKTSAVLSCHHSEWLSGIIWYRCCENVERNMRGCAWYTRCHEDAEKKKSIQLTSGTHWSDKSLASLSRGLHSSVLITSSYNDLMRVRIVSIQWSSSQVLRTFDWDALTLPGSLVSDRNVSRYHATRMVSRNICFFMWFLGCDYWSFFRRKNYALSRKLRLLVDEGPSTTRGRDMAWVARQVASLSSRRLWPSRVSLSGRAISPFLSLWRIEM